MEDQELKASLDSVDTSFWGWEWGPVSTERSRSILPRPHPSLHLLLGFGVLSVWFHLYLSFSWLPAGDIAFRFLRYVEAQHQRKRKRQLRAQQNLSWEEIAKKYQHEEDPLGGSLVIVCDINREMLKVGQQKALDQGHTAGESLSSPRHCLHVYRGR